MSKKRSKRKTANGRPARGSAKASQSEARSPRFGPGALLTKGPLPRVAVAIIVLLATHVGVVIVRAGYAPAQIAPTRSLSELPLQLDEWTGEELALDPRVFDAVAADETVNRLYRNRLGEYVSMHLARWDEVEEWAPHIPPLCYRRSGYQQENFNQTVLRSNDGRTANVYFATMSRHDERKMILYWFQRGPHLFHDRNSARIARRQLWGKGSWPPLVKVLMEAPAGDDGQAEQRLLDLAKPVFHYTQALHERS